jgi:mono/diheme cytochrome c family protein
MKKILVALVMFSSSALIAASGNDIEKGKALFNTNCATCHGADAKEVSDIGKSLNPKARNLTTEPLQEPNILKTINEGFKGGSTGMVSFKHLPDPDKKALVAFVTSLRPAAGKKAEATKPAAKK